MCLLILPTRTGLFSCIFNQISFPASRDLSVAVLSQVCICLAMYVFNYVRLTPLNIRTLSGGVLTQKLSPKFSTLLLGGPVEVLKW